MAEPDRFLNWLVERPFAHRGLFHERKGIPENSLGAFERAIGDNYGIELDVRRSLDDVAVVFHDRNLARLTDQTEQVSRASYRMLSGISLLGSEFKIPSLFQVLDLVDGRVPVLIEIKSDGRVGPLESSVRRALEGYDGHVGVMSFSPAVLDFFKRHCPNVPRGYVTTHRPNAPSFAWPSRFTYGPVWRAHTTGCDFVAADIRSLPTPLTRSSRRRGRPVVTWTVRSEKHHETAKKWADNVIFEAPDARLDRPETSDDGD